MADTLYTQGFKAGLAWQTAHQAEQATETEAIRQNYNLGVLAGEARERARLIDLLSNRICFDHRDEGSCDHNSCYTNIDLIAILKGTANE